MAERLHLFVIDQLTDRILAVFQLMVQFVEQWSATDMVLDPSKDGHTMAYMYRCMQRMPLFKTMARIRTDGSFIGTYRFSTGEVTLGNRPPSRYFNDTSVNLTYYHVLNSTDTNNNDDHPQYVLGTPARVVNVELRAQPYYLSVAKYNRVAISTPFRTHADNSQLISLGTPVVSTLGQFDGVVLVTFPFSAFEAVLDSARLSLQSSGMFLLIGNDNLPIALSTSSPGSTDRDVAEIQSVAISEDQMGTVMKHSFNTFGSSFFFALEISETSKFKPPAAGLHWTLYAVLPMKDYYETIWHDNVLVAIYAAIYFVVFLVTLFAMFHLIITKPVRSLKQQLVFLSEAIRDHSHQITPVRYRSYFTEMRELYKAASEAVIAQKEVAEMRSEELARAAALAIEHETEARSMMQAKEMFIAVMSHEMRTPLTACIGMAEILLETTELDGHQTECVNIILSSGSSLLGLVNDILDLSKIQADRMVLENVSFDLRLRIEELMGILQLKAEEKGLELIACVKADVPEQIVGDPTRLKQILLNILNNSIKFTASGMVSLMVSVSEDRSCIEFMATDTGIGLSTECLSRLFQPFMQGELSMTRRYGGTGLGLVISKKFVELMGGTIQMFSEGEGRGSRVFISLPIHTKADPERCERFDRAVSEINLVARQAHDEFPSVIVMDNQPFRREALCEMLKVLRVQFFPMESIHELKACPSDSPALDASVVVSYLPDHALMVHEVEEAMQKTGRDTRGLPERRVVWITSMKAAQTDDLPIRSADRIALPLTMHKLRTSLLAHSANHGDNLRSHSTSAVSTATGPVHILVVDDVIVNQRVIGLKLQQHGFEDITYANNGKEAVEIVTAAPFVFDYILMDVMMPEMNGYEATQAIRMDPRYHLVPIIGITGNCAINDLRQCFESGMTAALGKPIDSEKLFSVMKQHGRRSSGNTSTGGTSGINANAAAH